MVRGAWLRLQGLSPIVLEAGRAGGLAGAAVALASKTTRTSALQDGLISAASRSRPTAGAPSSSAQRGISERAQHNGRMQAASRGLPAHLGEAPRVVFDAGDAVGDALLELRPGDALSSGKNAERDEAAAPGWDAIIEASDENCIGAAPNPNDQSTHGPTRKLYAWAVGCADIP